MKENIRYGWIDINNFIHIGNMKNFRRIYKTMTIDEICIRDNNYEWIELYPTNGKYAITIMYDEKENLTDYNNILIVN